MNFLEHPLREYLFDHRTEWLIDSLKRRILFAEVIGLELSLVIHIKIIVFDHLDELLDIRESQCFIVLP